VSGVKYFEVDGDQLVVLDKLLANDDADAVQAVLTAAKGGICRRRGWYL